MKVRKLLANAGVLVVAGVGAMSVPSIVSAQLLFSAGCTGIRVTSAPGDFASGSTYVFDADYYPDPNSHPIPPTGLDLDGAWPSLDGLTARLTIRDPLANIVFDQTQTTSGCEAPSPAVNPVQPARILDTRSGPGQLGYAGGKPGIGGVVSLLVAGEGGVPVSGAAAVTMNVTLTESDGAGFVTVWPSGTDRPLSSNLNAPAEGSTVSNLVTVPIGADGKVNLFTQTGGHLLADISGWVPAGAYVPKTPTRLLDTREGPTQLGYTGAKPGVGSIVELQVSGTAGIPSTGVSAVVMNVTATEASAAGFVTVWPTGQERPLASSLNLEAAGATAPNQVTVPLGADGKVSLFTQSGAHLLADLAGYYTISTGFTPLAPARILDTRPGPTQTGYVDGKPAATSTVSLQVAGRGGVPATGAGSVILNVTATEATAPGFVTVWPGQTPQPNSSVLNLTAAGQTRPNAVLVPIGADGTINLFTQSGTHFIVDVAGWFPS